jgi:putative FmdB family regulatory protein
LPIYEYQCPDCGHRFEQLQKISDAPIRVCPNCNQEHLRKLVSQTSFVLKGGGWYKDHYGLKGKDGKEAKSDSAKEAAPASSDKPATTDKPTAAPAATETKATPAPPPKKTPSSAA